MSRQKRSNFLPTPDSKPAEAAGPPPEPEEFEPKGVLKRQEGKETEHFKYTIKRRKNGWYYLEGNPPACLRGSWPRLDKLEWEIHVYEHNKSSYYRNNPRKHIIKE